VGNEAFARAGRQRDEGANQEQHRALHPHVDLQ
jgi:hypothetical protein